MNTMTQTEAAALTQRQAATQDVCNILKNWFMPSHKELVTVSQAFAAKVNDCGCLGSVASKNAVSSQDDVSGQIEQDMLDQRAKAMWKATKQRRAS